jgi:tRNA (mo5U34)-methyltransferase
VGLLSDRHEHKRVGRLKAEVASVRWFHSIDLDDGIVTPGETTPEGHAALLEAMEWPDLTGKTVLDVGAYDGFYSFEAERRAAARVVALDHYVWGFDLNDVYAYYERCRAEGVIPEPYHEVPGLWHPDELPGKRGFDIAHAALESKVEVMPADFMEMDLAELGQFDVVLFLGVLYHMQDPVRAMRRLGEVTRELAIIETEAVRIPGFEDHPVCEFFPTAELNHDISNWWAPNAAAVMGMCRPAGFRHARMLVEAPPVPEGQRLIRYRTIMHAHK